MGRLLHKPRSGGEAVTLMIHGFLLINGEDPLPPPHGCTGPLTGWSGNCDGSPAPHAGASWDEG